MNFTRFATFQVSAATRETSYANGGTVDSLIKVAVGSLPILDVNVQVDDDLADGNEEPQSQEVSAKYTRFPINQPRVRPHTLAFIGAYAFGTATASLVSSSLVYKHMIRMTDKMTLPTTVVEGKIKTGLQKKYIGVGVDNFRLSIPRGADKWVALAANALGSGTVADGTATTLEPSEEALTGGTMACFLDATTWDNTTSDALDVTSSELNGSPADIASEITNIAYDFRNNIDADFNYELGAGLVFGNMWRMPRTQTVTVSVLADSYDEMGYLTGQTDLAMDLKVRGSLIEDSRYYGFQMICPLLRANSVEPADDGGKLVYNIEYRVMQKGTYDSTYLDVYNKQTSAYAG